MHPLTRPSLSHVRRIDVNKNFCRLFWQFLMDSWNFWHFCDFRDFLQDSNNVCDVRTVSSTKIAVCFPAILLVSMLNPICTNRKVKWIIFYVFFLFFIFDSPSFTDQPSQRDHRPRPTLTQSICPRVRSQSNILAGSSWKLKRSVKSTPLSLGDISV